MAFIAILKICIIYFFIAIIIFTSTNIQKIKEESNYNASTINLGKCEDILKYVYNISKESILYILKIDKEQKGKNYPSVEYDVFYPINNNKIDILNLSYCESTNIEISFPIEINSLSLYILFIQ